MRTWIVLLAALLVGMGDAAAQEIKPSSPEYHYLDSVCRWAIEKFGEKGFIESCKGVNPKITLKKFVGETENYGRNYYEVFYPNDLTKPVRLEYDYIAKVTIWQDTYAIDWLMFGSGWGYAGAHIEKMLQEEKAGKPVRKMKYVLVDYGAIRREGEEFRKMMEEIDRKARAKSAAKDKEKLAKDAEVIRKWEEEVAKRHEKEMAKKRRKMKKAERRQNKTVQAERERIVRDTARMVVPSMELERVFPVSDSHFPLKITGDEVRAAKEWMEKVWAFDEERGVRRDSNFLLEEWRPLWDSAVVSVNAEKRQKAVDVPVAARARASFASEECSRKYKETGNSAYIHSCTRLVVLFDYYPKDSTAETASEVRMNEFFMLIDPSLKFREAKNFDVFRSTYLYRQEGFDGLIHFYHTDGSYSNGWRYQDGKIVSRLMDKKPEKTDGGIRKVKASHYWGAGRTDCW